MKDLVAKRGIAERFRIESAATSAEEIGNPVHEGTRSRLAREGISCEGKTARRLKASDYDEFDVIVGMDEANMAFMRRLFGSDPAGKVHKLLEFAGQGRDVADPWYTGDFDQTFDDVMDGCVGLLGWLHAES